MEAVSTVLREGTVIDAWVDDDEGKKISGPARSFGRLSQFSDLVILNLDFGSTLAGNLSLKDKLFSFEPRDSAAPQRHRSGEICRRSSSVNTTEGAPMFSRSRSRRFVPGIGTISSLPASNHARASCPGVHFLSWDISSIR